MKPLVKDLIAFAIMFLVALSEILLIIFRSSFENNTLVNALLIILPVTFILLFYLRHRKYHLRHLYTDEELEKQHRK